MKVFSDGRACFGSQPFTLKIFGHKLYIISKLADVSSVIKDPKLNINQLVAEDAKNLYDLTGSSTCSISEYIGGGRLTPDGPELEDIHRWLRNELSGNAFDVLSTRVIHELERFLDAEETKLVARHDGSPIETDFYGWLQGALAIPVINVAFFANITPAAFWMIMHVITIPGLADRLREEVGPAFNSGYPNIDYIVSYKTCPLLRSVFCETLRTVNWAVAPRHVDSDTTIGGYTLKAGNQVFCPGRLPMLDPQIWDVSRKMKPFGGGNSLALESEFWDVFHMRNYMLNFAALEIKEFVASSLLRFDFELPDGMPKMDLKTPTFVILHGAAARVRISKRLATVSHP
ncbi:hypothetical protein FRB96_006713 [Tulasnella sp. 330]|nr:hypothetical protein FRB96_006713 [Tulasnella sp. 330]